jgi:hypothetical protein
MLRELDHTYWCGPERILGCTESLTLLGIFDPTRYPIEARDRGDRVHRHTAARDAGKRKRHPLEPTDRPYVDSWTEYLAVWRPEFVLVEAQLWHPDLRVAGTVDRVAILQRPGIAKHLARIDIKTGLREPWHRYQLSIYQLLVDRWLQTQPKRLQALPRINYSVYLKPDGREPLVRAVEYEPVVVSFIAAAQAKRLL